MSSSTMPEKPALRFKDISKDYKLFSSRVEQFAWLLGLGRFISLSKPKTFSALKDISFDVPRGRRLGIIGRNGAGKTTLLKLICGNFTPSSGEVEVNGTVQALMRSGLGFHPEYTGRENVIASLQYNGIAQEDYGRELAEIIEFCELGDFIDQPFKTYSLGMQARLMFAAATAIRPDILIVDEVLGAGDAYFVAKCKRRVEKLISSGCTLLLVSHSMSQVLELCQEAIWLDKGQIRMRGDAFSVVKEYEEFVHGGSCQTSSDRPAVFTPKSLASAIPEGEEAGKRGVLFQEPFFIPHSSPAAFPDINMPTEFKFQAAKGVSRWGSPGDIKLQGFTIVSEREETDRLVSMRPAKVVLCLLSEQGGSFNCRYAFTVYDHMGRSVLNVLSPKDSFDCKNASLHPVSLVFNPLQLGPGEYVASVSVHMYEDLAVIGSTPRYDLLSRSFQFNVEIPDSLSALSTQFYHSAEWQF